MRTVSEEAAGLKRRQAEALEKSRSEESALKEANNYLGLEKIQLREENKALQVRHAQLIKVGRMDHGVK